MWYFAWLLGLPLAAIFAVMNAMWLELKEDEKLLNGDGPTPARPTHGADLRATTGRAALPPPCRDTIHRWVHPMSTGNPAAQPHVALSARIRAIPFALSWWALSFPLAALTIASFGYAEAAGSAPHGMIGMGLLALLVAVVSGLSLFAPRADEPASTAAQFDFANMLKSRDLLNPPRFW